MDIHKLIVGLGNPGQEYEKTRHNFGFLAVECLEALCEEKGQLRRLSGKKDAFILSHGSIPTSLLHGSKNNLDVLLLRPLTFMNKSGEAVRQVTSFYRIQAADTLVLHDELDLPFGRMKLKKGGGNAGHNGLKSIQQCLSTADFYRLRLGIGKPEHQEVYSYVLSNFPKAAQPDLDKILQGTLESIFLFLAKGETPAQQFCNSFKLP